MPPGFREILGHLPEGFQDHGIFEFAEIEIAAPGEGDRAGVRLVERHGLSAPDRNSAVRAFYRLARCEAAFDGNEGKRNVIDHECTSRVEGS
jgi:hypothetical protein